VLAGWRGLVLLLPPAVLSSQGSNRRRPCFFFNDFFYLILVDCFHFSAWLQVEGLLLQQAQAQGGGAAAGASSRPAFVFRSTPQALMAIGRREGWRALFAGLSINYLKVTQGRAPQGVGLEQLLCW
jgi:hypothetical protein